MKGQRVINYSTPSAWHGAAGGVREELGARDVAQSAK